MALMSSRGPLSVKAIHRGRVVGTPWPGIYCTHVESSRHYGRHSHATFGVGILERGAHVSVSGRGKVEAYAGDVITVNPGEVHDGRPLGATSRRWRIVYLDPDAMPHVEISRPVIRDAHLGRALLNLFLRLDRWSRGDDRACAETLACEEALVLALGLLGERHTTGPGVREIPVDVKRARDRLADDSLAPTLSELAAMSGVSRYQLLRRFEKVYGLPPHAWRRQLRIERVRRLIRGGASLSAAAALSGFADQSHMTRVFTAQFGFTPGAWRTAVASAPPAPPQ